MKKRRFAARIPAMGALIIVLVGFFGTKAAEQDQSKAEQGLQREKDTAELAKHLSNPMVKGKVVSEDGSVAAIFYGGDIMGNLDVCG